MDSYISVHACSASYKTIYSHNEPAICYNKEQRCPPEAFFKLTVEGHVKHGPACKTCVTIPNKLAHVVFNVHKSFYLCAMCNECGGKAPCACDVQKYKDDKATTMRNVCTWAALVTEERR